MDLTEVRFLLDENIPIKLKQLFPQHNLQCVTIKEKNWLGIKNGDLSVKVRDEEYLLVTRDKDFTFLWKKYSIRVIFIAIEPATLEHIEPIFVNLLDDWKYDLSKPFLLMLQKDSIRLWY